MAAVTGLSALQLEQSTLLFVLVFPGLIWAALRFGSKGATVAITIICAFAVWSATNDLGEFAVGSINARLLDTQLFIATVSLSALAIAALVSERAQLADGLRASRARLVEASDEARRVLERDLHDSAQQDLIGLRLKLGRAAEAIPEDPVEGERQVSVIGRQMDDVLEHLRAIATGVYSPLLHERGITDALTSAARRSVVPTSVRSVHAHRHSESVERAVYFCCLEALQNSTKHGGPGVEATVELREEPTALWFEVRDSGAGFDPKAHRAGSGLANMRDRIEAVGGSLTITSRVGHGTAVRGRVPLRAAG
jgi:signal transduction histidine kinase